MSTILLLTENEYPERLLTGTYTALDTAITK